MNYTVHNGRLVLRESLSDFGKAWGLPTPERQDAPSCKASGRVQYVETSAPSVGTDADVTEIVQICAQELGIKARLDVRWFAPAASAGSARLLNAQPFDGTPCKGFVDCKDPRVIWLDRTLRGDLLFEVALHEAEHARQELVGECGKLSDATLEAKARAYSAKHMKRAA